MRITPLEHNGKYYTVRSIGRGLWLTGSRFMSKFGDGKTWEEARVKVWMPPALLSDKWNKAQHWAPELHYINDNWCVFYAAGTTTDGPYWTQRAGVLISTTDTPFGPYEEHDAEPLFTGEIKERE